MRFIFATGSIQLKCTNLKRSVCTENNNVAQSELFIIYRPMKTLFLRSLFHIEKSKIEVQKYTEDVRYKTNEISSA